MSGTATESRLLPVTVTIVPPLKIYTKYKQLQDRYTSLRECERGALPVVKIFAYFAKDRVV